MYKVPVIKPSRLRVNKSVEGTPIEIVIEKMISNNEPIGGDVVPIIYTERSQGVLPAYDIRTDRWEVAVDGTDKISKSYQAKREDGIKKRAEEKKEKETKGQSTEGKSQNGDSQGEN